MDSSFINNAGPQELVSSETPVSVALAFRQWIENNYNLFDLYNLWEKQTHDVQCAVIDLLTASDEDNAQNIVAIYTFEKFCMWWKHMKGLMICNLDPLKRVDDYGFGPFVSSSLDEAFIGFNGMRIHATGFIVYSPGHPVYEAHMKEGVV